MNLTKVNANETSEGISLELIFEDGTTISQNLAYNTDIMITAIALKRLASAVGDHALD